MFNYKLLIVFLLLVQSIYADVEDIDTLLNDIQRKTDLSQKTKLENSGIYVIYTRDDIERMQARHLKDILKSNSIFGYDENRYGVVDPLGYGTNIPFMSGSIRVYIDNQEMLGGISGSGLIMYGDLDIGFVDHIEIYTHEPTYEYTTEPTMILIKLYSKSSLKDEGSKIELNVGSFKDSRVSGHYATELDEDWSLFSYVSLEDDKRERYDSSGSELSRDKKTAHIFASIKNENHNILIDAVTKNADNFISESLDATPLDVGSKQKSLHIGYDLQVGNFSFLSSYDYYETKGYFYDDVTPVPTYPFDGMYPIASKLIESPSTIFTAEIKHKLVSTDNTLISGIKYRNKRYKSWVKSINGISIPKKDSTYQEAATLFMEDLYSLQEHLLLTFGVKLVNVKNRDSQFYKNDTQLNYRVGLTYLYDKWIFKTIGAKNTYYLEPYLVDSHYIAPNKKLSNAYTSTLYEDIIYTDKKNRYELILGLSENEQFLFPDPNYNFKLNNHNKEILQIGALFRWIHTYNKYDSVFSEVSYQHLSNIPLIDANSYQYYKVVVRSLNTYRNFDIVNELIYNRDNIKKKNFLDYTAGVKYRYNKELSISLKAQNILNKASKTDYFRVNPLTLEEDEPLKISPTDRKATLSMEYLF